MYTFLRITVKSTEAESRFSAIELLAMLQQALPGMAPPASGLGTEDDPWTLTSPREWWYAARMLARGGAGRLWFYIGGRLISVNKADRYAADHGAVGRAARPSDDQFGDDHGPTYPAIYGRLVQDLNGLGNSVKNKAVAQQIRALLGGAQTLATADSSAIPVLTAAFFLSECSRNFTAFHTGLMILDLIQAEVKIGISTCTWENVLWHPAVLNAQTELEADAARPVAERRRVLEMVKDFEQDKNAFGKTVSRDAIGGLHPMAHEGSVAQSKSDLVGNLKASMTMVRQVEATVLIRWLATGINKFEANYTAQAMSETLSERENRQFDDLLMAKAATASSALDAAEKKVKLGSAVAKKVAAYEALMANDMSLPHTLLLPVMQLRVFMFDCML